MLDSLAGKHAAAALDSLGVKRVPVPVPFAEAGGPANIYVIEERDGGVALFDAGIGTREGRSAIEEGFAALGLSLGDVRRIFVSHGHIDHYGYARAAQEASGAPVFVHPRDHDKVTGRDRTKERLDRYAAYLSRLGAPLDLLEHVGTHWMDAQRMARPIEHVEPLAAGTVLSFARFDAEVLHLREYLRSIRRVRALDVELVAPGHAEPFSGHAEVIDRLLGFYQKRQDKLLALLQAGPRTPAELSNELFPRAKPSHLYLTLSETLGNLEVLEEQRYVARHEAAGRMRFELV